MAFLRKKQQGGTSLSIEVKRGRRGRKKGLKRVEWPKGKRGKEGGKIEIICRKNVAISPGLQTVTTISRILGFLRSGRGTGGPSERKWGSRQSACKRKRAKLPS